MYFSVIHSDILYLQTPAEYARSNGEMEVADLIDKFKVRGCVTKEREVSCVYFVLIFPLPHQGPVLPLPAPSPPPSAISPVKATVPSPSPAMTPSPMMASPAPSPIPPPSHTPHTAAHMPPPQPHCLLCSLILFLLFFSVCSLHCECKAGKGWEVCQVTNRRQ